MKDIFKTGLYIMAFAFAGIFFQISCSNSDESARTSDTEKFVFVKKDFPVTGGQSIWIANIDGSDKTQIPITLPPNVTFYSIYSSGEHSSAKLVNDGQTVLFTAQSGSVPYIYSCNVDGTDLQQLAEFDANTGVFL